MEEDIQQERIRAVQHFFNGEKPEAICASFINQEHGFTSGLSTTVPMTTHGAQADLVGPC